MTVPRIVALIAIYAFACAGWLVLGKATSIRSLGSMRDLSFDVQQLWGDALVQQAPRFTVAIPGTEQVRQVMPSENNIKVRLDADHRKKGLVWYPTYTCNFSADYVLRNEDPVAKKVRLAFQFPGSENTYDQFRIALDDVNLTTPINVTDGIAEIIELEPGQSRTFHLAYQTRGLTSWRYSPDPSVGRIQGLDLEVTTNFPEVDYPAGSLSPDTANITESGATLSWKTNDRLSLAPMGVIIPEKLNPGPLTTRITFFAPVCLFFFFILIMTIQVLYRVNVHPMHYLFVAAGFFAFHLLLSYLVGVISVHLAFAVSASISVVMVTAYLRGAMGRAFPWRFATIGQLFFLVLFSYSFFMKGITGLTVAIGSVATLAILMRATATLDWNEVFQRKPKPPAPNIPPPIPPTEA